VLDNVVRGFEVQGIERWGTVLKLVLSRTFRFTFSTPTSLFIFLWFLTFFQSTIQAIESKQREMAGQLVRIEGSLKEMAGLLRRFSGVTPVPGEVED